MTAAKSRLSATFAPALLAAFAAQAGAQVHYTVTPSAPPTGGVQSLTPGIISPYNQVQLGQMWRAQQEAYSAQQAQANQQLIAQQQAQAAQQRQQIVTGFRNVAQGQPPSQAFAGLQSSYYGGYPQPYGYYVAGFAPYPQFQGYQDPTAGGMPFADPMAGNAPPRAVAPAVPFDKAQAMKAKAFDTPQHRAAVTKAKAAKARAAKRKAPAPKKEKAPAEKPVEAEKPAPDEAAAEN